MDLKTLENVFVGSGVFIWLVDYKFEDGGQQVKIYKQGIARVQDPNEGCSL